jgi:phosphatidylserine decarboxylase
MRKTLFILAQYLLPKKALSHFAGWLAECQWPPLKALLIRYFLFRYPVDLSTCVLEEAKDYKSFNAFFTRALKPGARMINSLADTIISPVDGQISQIGSIQDDTLLQAKGFTYSLLSLLGGNSTYAQLFKDGKFTTLYLAPKDYHRVHMPIDGKLTDTLYVPGKLFSVNHTTAESIENLFSRNERYICIFDTAIGPMAMILVGAMLVGSIQTQWQMPALDQKTLHPCQHNTQSITLKKGDEMGHFKMGSTVILLFAKGKIEWQEGLCVKDSLQLGNLLGRFIS